MKHKGLLYFVAGLAAALALGWFAFPAALYESVEQPLQFSHKVHTGEAVGLTCENCHSFRDDGSFAGIPGLEQCAGCHSDVMGSTQEEKQLVDEYVKAGREIPWLVYARQPQNAYFSHAQHVKLAGLACEKCHGPHGSSDGLRPFERNRISGYSRDIWGSSIAGVKTAEWDGMKMDDCSDCHRTRGIAESCIDCHK